MMHGSQGWRVAVRWAAAVAIFFVLAACAGRDETPGAPPAGVGSEIGSPVDAEHAGSEAGFDDALPALDALGLGDGELVRVAATTNIVADIVAQVGGDRIELTALMPPGADPHSYAPTPQDLRHLNEAHVIFVNGLGLEEALLPILTNLDREVPIVSVNVGVDTVEFGGASHAHDDDHDYDADHDTDHDTDHEEDGEDDHDHAHDHDGDDPHTWQSVRNVMVWVTNIEHALSALDPDHAADYAANAQVYLEELEALDGEIRALVAQIPAENRKLVTDHDTFSYFARDYEFEVLGAVIPSFSTVAAPSAQELAALQDQMEDANVRAIFAGTTVNPALAERLAEDLGIEMVSLYSDSLSEPDGPAANYLDFMRYNVAAMVDALH
jgi:ABC-type Zn uptake system ZnuABC Zn-binding protein ZnuA